MNVLKAYTDAGALSQQGYSAMKPQRSAARAAAPREHKSGDLINISQEARDMLANNGQNSLSVMPQDATYDQTGHVTRQLDILQGELRHLASQLTANPSTVGMIPHIGAMQSRLASIRTQV